MSLLGQRPTAAQIGQYATYKDRLGSVTEVNPSDAAGALRPPKWTQPLEEGATPLYEVLTCIEDKKEDPEEQLERLKQAAYREGYEAGLKRA